MHSARALRVLVLGIFCAKINIPRRRAQVCDSAGYVVLIRYWTRVTNLMTAAEPARFVTLATNHFEMRPKSTIVFLRAASLAAERLPRGRRAGPAGRLAQARACLMGTGLVSTKAALIKGRSS